MGKSAPSPPDPVATANAQTAANEQTATYNAGLNRPDQYTPYGSQTYTYLGNNPDGSPHYRSDVNLSPTGQQIFNQQQQQDQQVNNIANGYMGRIQDTMGQGLNLSGLPQIQGNVSNGPLAYGTGYNAPIQSQLNFSNLNAIPTSSNDFAAQGQQAQDAIMSRMQPELDRQQQLLDNGLANQGIMPGSDAWNYQQKVLAQQKNDALNQAVTSGYNLQNQLYGQALGTRQQLAGEDVNQGQFANTAQAQGYGQAFQNAGLYNTAQQQSFNQGLQNAQLSNAANQQQFSQDLQQRELPLNEFNALRSASQIQSPQFNAMLPSMSQPTDVAGPITDAYNQKAAAYNSQMSGLYNLGGAMTAMFASSDRRLKRNIRKVGKTPAGINVYEFRYLNDDKKHTGVMAQEVERVIPEAVITRSDGYKMVNYGLVR